MDSIWGGNIEIKKRLFRNVFSISAARTWAMVVNFFLFPFIVRQIGIEATGVWVLTQAVVGYFGLIDVGVGPSLIKYVAEHLAKKDQKRINQQAVSSFFIFLLLGLISSIGLVLIGRYLLGYFKIEPELFGQAQLVFYMTAVFVIASFPMSSLRGVLSGHQKYNRTALAQVTRSIVAAIFIIGFLLTGGGLIQLVLAGFIGAASGWLVNGWFIFKETSVSFHPKFLSKEALKRVIHFGGAIFVINLCSLVIYRVDQLVIGFFLGTGPITFYESASKLYRLTSRIPNLLVTPVLPLSSELHAKKDNQRLQILCFRGTKYTLGLFLALTIPMVIIARQILEIWMGVEFGQYAYILWILVIHVFININYSIMGQILLGMDRVRFLLWYHVALAILNFVLSVILVQFYGLAGVALGTTIPFALLGWLYIKKALNYLKSNYKTYFAKVWLPTLPIGILVFAVTLVAENLLRVSGITEVIIFFAASAILYLIPYYFFSLQKEEKQDLLMIINVIFQRLGLIRKKS